MVTLGGTFLLLSRQSDSGPHHIPPSQTDLHRKKKKCFTILKKETAKKNRRDVTVMMSLGDVGNRNRHRNSGKSMDHEQALSAPRSSRTVLIFPI